MQIPTEGGDGGDATTTSETARICLQISHAGRYSHHPVTIPASKTKSPMSMFEAGNLTTTEIHSTVLDLVNCAVLRTCYNQMEDNSLFVFVPFSISLPYIRKTISPVWLMI